jgi:hypothetical protein
MLRARFAIIVLGLAVGCASAVRRDGAGGGASGVGGSGGGEAGTGGGEGGCGGSGAQEKRDASAPGGSGGQPTREDAMAPDEEDAGPPDVQIEPDATIEDDAAPDRAGVEAGVRTGNACPGYKKGTHTQSGVSVADFCAAFAKTCMFKSTGMLFTDQADCEATYGAGSDTVRTCRAGHLCEAVASTTTNGRTSNCQAAGHGTVCH